MVYLAHFYTWPMAPFGDYVIRDHLITCHLAFGLKVLCPPLSNTYKYNLATAPLAFASLEPQSAYVTPKAPNPSPLASFMADYSFWSGTLHIVMY